MTGGWNSQEPKNLMEGAKAFDFKKKFLTLSKVLLNVLALYYGLESLSSWGRVDELMALERLSPDAGAKFKEYLDITAGIRMKYQFFYEKEALDFISPTKGLTAPDDYEKGYYVLTNDDRKGLLKAQKIQKEVLVGSVVRLNKLMNGRQDGRTRSKRLSRIDDAVVGCRRAHAVINTTRRLVIPT